MIIDPSERDNKDSSTVNEDNDVIDNTEFPNNDFGQYTIHNILRQQDEMNIAQVQHGKKEEAWENCGIGGDRNDEQEFSRWKHNMKGHERSN